MLSIVKHSAGQARSNHKAKVVRIVQGKPSKSRDLHGARYNLLSQPDREPADIPADVDGFLGPGFPFAHLTYQVSSPQGFLKYHNTNRSQGDYY